MKTIEFIPQISKQTVNKLWKENKLFNSDIYENCLNEFNRLSEIIGFEKHDKREDISIHLWPEDHLCYFITLSCDYWHGWNVSICKI